MPRCRHRATACSKPASPTSPSGMRSSRWPAPRCPGGRRPSRADHFRVYLHLDEAGAWFNAGRSVPEAVLRRLTCDGAVRPVFETPPVAPCGSAGRRGWCRTTCAASCSIAIGCAAIRPASTASTSRSTTSSTGATAARPIRTNLLGLCGKHHRAHHAGEFTIAGNTEAARRSDVHRPTRPDDHRTASATTGRTATARGAVLRPRPANASRVAWLTLDERGPSGPAPPPDRRRLTPPRPLRSSRSPTGCRLVAARRAGMIAASTARTMATIVKMTIDSHGTANEPKSLVAQRAHDDPAEHQAEGDTHHRADQGGQDGLPQRAPGHLAAGRADGAHQAELAAALVHRQQQRDHDAEDGDEDRHAEQGVDEVEERVDLVGLAVDVLVTGLELRRRELVDDPLDLRARGRRGRHRAWRLMTIRLSNTGLLVPSNVARVRSGSCRRCSSRRCPGRPAAWCCRRGTSPRPGRRC